MHKSSSFGSRKWLPSPRIRISSLPPRQVALSSRAVALRIGGFYPVGFSVRARIHTHTRAVFRQRIAQREGSSPRSPVAFSHVSALSGVLTFQLATDSPSPKYCARLAFVMPPIARRSSRDFPRSRETVAERVCTSLRAQTAYRACVRRPRGTILYTRDGYPVHFRRTGCCTARPWCFHPPSVDNAVVLPTWALPMGWAVFFLSLSKACARACVARRRILMPQCRANISVGAFSRGFVRLSSSPEVYRRISFCWLSLPLSRSSGFLKLSWKIIHGNCSGGTFCARDKKNEQIKNCKQDLIRAGITFYTR